jgi:oligopeptide transport system substrate-binding protein
MRFFNLFAVCALCLLCACPVSDSTGSRDRSNSPAVSSNRNEPAVAAKGGVIRLPLEYVLPDTPPAVADLDLSDPRLWALTRCIELPLVRVTPTGELLPGLATSWEPSSDSTVWHFTLHQKSEGLAAELHEKLLANWRAILQGDDSPLRGQLADLVAGAQDFRDGKSLDISGVSFDGAGLLSIELTRSHTRFPMWVRQPGLGLVDGYAPFTTTPQSNTWDGNELVLTANPDSLVGAPLLDELRFVFLANRAEQVKLFREGMLDAANIPNKRAAAIEADAELSAMVVRHETSAMILGIMDLSEFPWGDGEFQPRLGLRQAVNWGFNLVALAEDENNQFAPWPHMLPETQADYIDAEYRQKPPLSLGQRIEDARQGLKDADLEQGNGLPQGMDLAYLPGEHLNSLAQGVRDYWQEISVRLGLFGEPREVLFDRIARSGHEVVLKRVYPAYPDPDAFCYPLLHSSLAGLGGNWSMLRDSGIDEQIEQGQAAVDSNTRQLVYRKLTREVEDRALFVCLGYATPSLLLSPELAGYQLTPYDFDASLPAQDFTQLGRAASE